MYRAQPTPPPAHGPRLHNVGLAVGDLSAMITWYESRLGFVVTERGRFDAVNADFAMLEASGLRIELVSRAVALGDDPVDNISLAPVAAPGTVEFLVSPRVNDSRVSAQIQTQRQVPLQLHQRSSQRASEADSLGIAEVLFPRPCSFLRA